jgi:hypothetical protein
MLIESVRTTKSLQIGQYRYRDSNPGFRTILIEVHTSAHGSACVGRLGRPLPPRLCQGSSMTFPPRKAGPTVSTSSSSRKLYAQREPTVAKPLNQARPKPVRTVPAYSRAPLRTHYENPTEKSPICGRGVAGS